MEPKTVWKQLTKKSAKNTPKALKSHKNESLEPLKTSVLLRVFTIFTNSSFLQILTKTPKNDPNIHVFSTKMLPKNLSKSVLENGAKKHQKITHFCPLLGAIWAPKIIKIELLGSQQPPRGLQGSKKHTRRGQAAQKASKNTENPEKSYTKHKKKHVRCFLATRSITKKRNRTNNNDKNNMFYLPPASCHLPLSPKGLAAEA